MEIDLELKLKLFKEYLVNGGVEKIDFVELLEDIIKVKSLPNGKVDPNTISSSVSAAMNTHVNSQLMEPFMSDKYLSEYQTLLQKSIFFNQINIETKNEFDKIFDKYHNREEILFRGLNEAKYRLYSSIQQHWINSKLYENHKSFPNFLKSLVNNAKTEQGNTLTKYLENVGFYPENDLAVLSFLQHYRCPTPLLDWTYSFENALFFATENIHQPTTKWEIDKYFCVYFIEERYLNKSSLKEIVETILMENIEIFKKQLFEKLKAKGLTNEQIEKIYTEKIIKDMYVLLKGRDAITLLTKIEKLVTSPILYFSDFKRDFKINYCLNNNMNIVNQQGVFTWNSHPTMPLEHIANKEYNKENKGENYKFSKCININKNLASYVIEKIKNIGITREFLYPDPYRIAENTFNKTK